MPTSPTRIVFLCYSRRDAGIVRKCQVLIRAAGMIPWRDEHSIEPGAKWRLAVGAAIESCERVLVFWCRHAARSDEVRREYWSAITIGKTIAPIRLDRTVLPHPLRNYQATELGGWTAATHTLMTIERWLWLSGGILIVLGLVAYRFAA